MSNTKNTGGPAFPALKTTVNKSPGVYTSEVEPGMTLRDYFAGLAMQAMVANGGSLGSSEGLARGAYGYADAMIKAREQ